MLGVLLVVGILALPATWPLLVARRDRRVRTAAWGDAPQVDGEAALRGFKVAQLVVDDRRAAAWLVGVTGRAYAVDVTAQCARRGCVAPGLDCVCGFYAFRDRAAALELLGELSRRRPDRGYVLLDVDLDGEVLEYEHGFRAARQRVHRVGLPSWCGMCRAEGLSSPAGLVADPTQRAEQSVRERHAPVGTTLPRGAATVRAVCAAHQPARARRTSLSVLRDRLGTEIEQVPPPT